MMKSPPAPPVKEDRNTHEVSRDESRNVENHERQTSGGGHRSGSRGAGTSDKPDPRGTSGQGPRGCGGGLPWR